MTLTFMGSRRGRRIALQLNLFNLNLLRALDMLLDEQSVTRAAERLHVTQQAMSGSLKRLREHFNDELLVRIGLKLEPTPLGAALRVPVREAMLQIALAIDATPRFDPAESRRQFRVALSDYAVASFVPLLLTRVLSAAPGIGFELHNVSLTAFADLEMGNLDLTVQPNFLRRRSGGVPARLRSVPLYDDNASDVTDREWALIAPHLPPSRGGGRPRSTCLRRVVDAVFYLLQTGCQWRMLPRDFPPRSTVYGYFRGWIEAGVWAHVHDVLYRRRRSDG